MSPLHACSHCSSLNPQGQTICLHCDSALISSPPTRSSLMGNILKGAGMVAISMTLSACYGGGEEGFADCVDGDLDGVCQTVDCDDDDPANTEYCDQTPAGETANN